MLRKLASAAVLVAAGLLLPAVLPQIRWPWEPAVAMAGLVLPMPWAVGCAVVIPLLNSMVWGSPYLTTDLPLLVCQMIALAAFANFFYDMVGWNVFAALLAALALSFVVLFCAASIFGAVSGGLIRGTSYVRGTLTAGWPRMLLEIILVPPAVLVVRRMQERSGT